MTALSDYAENALLDHLLRRVTFTSPSTWISLHTGSLLDDGTGAEVSGGGYVRLQVASGAWDAAAAGATENSNDIDFGTATANWGNILFFGVWDASTAGNLLLRGELTASKTVNNGDGFKITASNLDISLT